MHKPSSVKDYAVAGLLAIVVMALLLLYLEARRGYVNGYILNKIFASTGAIMVGIVFLIGPLARHFTNARAFVRYRKEIGMVAGVLVIVHSLVSLFFLTERFPLSGYVKHLNTFLPGLLGVITLMFLIWISRQSILEKWGGVRWWKCQRWGLRIVIGATLVHVIWMKFPGWQSWFLKGGTADLAFPMLPPASLLATAFLGWVVLVRVVEYAALYPSYHVSIHHSLSRPPSDQPRVDGVRLFILLSALALLAFSIFLFWHGARGSV